jgi:hypothetical protein
MTVSKHRESDPVKLVLANGMHEEKGKLRPKGVVLAPVQTMVLAKYILQLNGLLNAALAEEEDEDEATT